MSEQRRGPAVGAGDLTLAVRGETLVLLPEHAAFWPRASTLLVADAHVGKAATFRALGVPVPRGTTLDALGRLDAALARTRATRVLFLGDFLHAREGRSPETFAMLSAWRAARPALELVLVRGNHDRRAGDPPAELGIVCVDEPLVEPPFAFAHYPAASDAGYVVAGHLHPGARLAGPGGQRERLPCFWSGSDCLVLPAFGDFTGLADIAPAAGDRVAVVAGNAVVPIEPPHREGAPRCSALDVRRFDVRRCVRRRLIPPRAPARPRR